MMNAHTVVAEALEDQPMPDDPAPAPGPGAASPLSAAAIHLDKQEPQHSVEHWAKARDLIRDMRLKRAKQAALEDELEFAIAYRHELAKKGLGPKDVAHVIRRGQPRNTFQGWGPILKRKGDPRWREASDSDVIGVHTHKAEDVLFDEWLRPPIKRAPETLDPSGH